MVLGLDGLGGPVAMLCDPNSIHPRYLASRWRSAGVDVVFVSESEMGGEIPPNGVRLIASGKFESRGQREIRKWTARVLWRVEKATQAFAWRLRTRLDAAENPYTWDSYFTRSVAYAPALVRATRSLTPRFVFGHEVVCYGLATALSNGFPRILLPWGHDIFLYPEASPLVYQLTRFALRSVDLVVPGSVTAAQYITKRFGVPPERVRGLTWGVDRTRFRRATHAERCERCARWGIDPSATVILNPRRFLPAWGCFVALETFMDLAAERPATHFVMLGGADAEEYVRIARTRLAERGLTSRFPLFDKEIPLKICPDLMSISDVFVSLAGLGDMPSFSVLQATASGAVPIVSDIPEHREMEKLGFTAFFVGPRDRDATLKALRLSVDHAEKRVGLAARNDG